MSQKVIISILVAVAVVLLGVFAYFHFSPTRQMISVVDEQFVAISIGNFDRAFTYLSKEKQAAMTKDDLTYYVNQHPVLWSNIKRNVTNAFVDGTGTGGNVDLDLENIDGLKGRVGVILVKEDDQWKISSYIFAPLL